MRLEFLAILLCSSMAFAESSIDEIKDDGEPLEIDADNSIACDESIGICTANGNAVATKGKFKVEADQLVLHFEKVDGKLDAKSLEAHGRVVMSTPTEQVHGDDADYDLAQERMIVTGRNLKIITEKQVLYARDTLEYWRAKQLGIARGNAVAVFPEKKQLMRADTLYAYFKKKDGSGDDSGKQELDHIDAIGNVLLSSDEEVATANRGTYHAKSETAELFEEVKLTRGENQIDGNYGTYNMKNNVARLFGSLSSKEFSANKRIHGRIIPKDAKNAKQSSLVKRES